MLGARRDRQGSYGAAGQADDHPRASHAQSRGGAVAEPAEQRVAHDREQRADSGDEREVLRCVVDADEVVDLQCQRHQQRAEEEQGPARVGQGVQRDEPPPDPGWVERREGDASTWRVRIRWFHTACLVVGWSG